MGRHASVPQRQQPLIGRVPVVCLFEPPQRFFKAVQPVNDSTDITLVSNLHKLKQSPAVGATPNQMAAFGMNYGYNNDQGSQG